MKSYRILNRTINDFISKLLMILEIIGPLPRVYNNKGRLAYYSTYDGMIPEQSKSKKEYNIIL